MGRPEDNLQEVVLSSHSVGPGDLIQVVSGLVASTFTRWTISPAWKLPLYTENIRNLWAHRDIKQVYESNIYC